MNTVGIIAEYNPFHNGHQILVEKCKNAGYENVVAVMSGNFVQRATPAITEKRVRASAALASGVDLVLELPLPYATASAQHFATGAIATLHATGVVDALCFGSELGEISPLWEIVDTINSPAFSENIVHFLSQGETFAKARTMSIGKIMDSSYENIATTPNNLLGIEYLAAIKKLGWNVTPITFKRVGVHHHSKETSKQFASASFLRESLGSIDNIAPFIPKSADVIYNHALNNGLYPGNFEKLETAVISYLRRLTLDEISLLPDISEGLENLFYKAISESNTIESLYSNLKSKRYTLSRVRRLVLCGFLGIKASYITLPPPYIRALGINTSASALLSKIKDNSSVPFSHSLKRLSDTGPTAKLFAELESFATDQYTLTLPKFQKRGYDFYSSAVFVK